MLKLLNPSPGGWLNPAESDYMMTTLYSKLEKRVQAYSNSVNDRARQLCKEAGLDPSLLGILPHNAMCGLYYGKPWPNIDYDKVRKVIYLTNEKQWAAHRILEAYCHRKLIELGPVEYFNYMHRETNQ